MPLQRRKDRFPAGAVEAQALDEHQPGAAARRIDRGLIADMLARLPGVPRVFICGSDPFAETARAIVAQLGVAPQQIRIESYGV